MLRSCTLPAPESWNCPPLWTADSCTCEQVESHTHDETKMQLECRASRQAHAVHRIAQHTKRTHTPTLSLTLGAGAAMAKGFTI
jgi:hypothetical protein